MHCTSAMAVVLKKFHKNEPQGGPIWSGQHTVLSSQEQKMFVPKGHSGICFAILSFFTPIRKSHVSQCYPKSLDQVWNVLWWQDRDINKNHRVSSPRDATEAQKRLPITTGKESRVPAPCFPANFAPHNNEKSPELEARLVLNKDHRIFCLLILTLGASSGGCKEPGWSQFLETFMPF